MYDDVRAWRGHPALVNGADGLLGSHLTERLLPLRATVAVPWERDSR